MVVNFPNNLDEVTLIAEPESVRLKNYVEEDDSEFNGIMILSLLRGSYLASLMFYMYIYI